VVRVQTRAGLAGVYCIQGRHVLAESVCRRALAIAEQELGPDDPEVDSLRNNLAVLYAARGSLRKAAALSQRALAVFEKTLGKNHPHTAVCRKNDARIARRVGRGL
jgi:Flp pilus assembly protein TadD